MANPDHLILSHYSEPTLFDVEQSTADRVNTVIRMYFNHPSLHGYNRIGEWPEYYNCEKGRFDSLLAGLIGETYSPGEIVMSSRSGFIRLIQRFQEESGIWRWEGLTLARDGKGIYQAEMVNRYYQYKDREAILIPRPLISFPLRPQQVLDEAINVYDSFRVRYDLVA